MSKEVKEEIKKYIKDNIEYMPDNFKEIINDDISFNDTYILGILLFALFNNKGSEENVSK